MEDLKKIYIQGLIPRVDSLKTQLDELKRDFSGSGESIRRLAHSLYGSGATYGFPRISEAARKTEIAPDNELESSLQELLNILQNTIEEFEKTPHSLFIIDDDPDIVLILKYQLARIFDKITVAETFEIAQSIIRTKDFSLILLDLILPDKDGREILIEMRKNSLMKRIPIIVMSSLTDFKHKQECYALGADGYIQKPFDPEEVSLMVQSTLDRYHPGRDSVYQGESDTQILNETELKEFFQKTRALMQRTRNHAALAKVAVDDLETLRQHFGRDIETKVILKAQAVISEHLRESDYLFRHDTGAFSVLFPDTTLDDASLILERILFYIREGSKDDIRFFMSAGLIDLGDIPEFQQAFNRSGALLNQAIDQGGNRVVINPRTQSLRNRILLAEDDRLMANIIIHNLKKAGFEVDYFSDGALALEGAEKGEYSLMIMDIKMPVIDGFELLRQVRMLPGKTHTPVLILTSMGNEDDIVRGFDAGADDYLLKPFSPKELVARINRILRGL